MNRILILLSLAFSAQTFAEVPWIQIAGFKICTSNWSLEDKKLVADLQQKLQGRTFELVEQAYEGESNRTLSISEIEVHNPAERFSEGEHQIFPYTMSFIDQETVKVNDKFVLPFELHGCDGGDLTIYNILNQPNHSRFTGLPKISDSELSICSGSCKGTLKPGQFRSILRYIEKH